MESACKTVENLEWSMKEIDWESEAEGVKSYRDLFSLFVFAWLHSNAFILAGKWELLDVAMKSLDTSNRDSSLYYILWEQVEFLFHNPWKLQKQFEPKTNFQE